MIALYSMSSVGELGLGGGVVYIGKGILLGADAGGGRYRPNDIGIRIHVTLVLTKGGKLVTGKELPPGAEIRMTADWPTTFANGTPQTITVAGRPVEVRFDRIGDIP